MNKLNLLIVAVTLSGLPSMTQLKRPSPHTQYSVPFTVQK
jgi:hypothetical protein